MIKHALTINESSINQSYTNLIHNLHESQLLTIVTY